MGEIVDKVKDEKIKIKLPDGSSMEAARGITPADIAKQIGARLAKDAVAASIDEVLVDLSGPVLGDCTLKIITPRDEEALQVLRHSASHVMAYAVVELFEGTRVTIGPAIEDGFYYDFDPPNPFSPEDIEVIEKKMAEIISEDLQFVREEWDREKALEFFRDRGERYKVELIEDIPEGETLSFYRCGDFIDLCEGPHIPSTGRISAFKLTSIAGAYWRGDEKNSMLQRIYGTAFFKKDELDQHLERMEEARKRDHRVLGKQLDLFSIQEEAGPGLVFWHPKGSVIRNIVEDFWKAEHYRRGYQLVHSPHIARSVLWQTSGHLDFYKENMYPPMEFEEGDYIIKPMNCPFHILIYKEGMKSYKDLPLRWAELGTVYRFERSGVLHGMKRVRGFTQDDAHIFCRPDQLLEEVKGLIDFTLFFLRAFGFDEYKVYLSTRPEKYVGTEENWEMATQTLKDSLDGCGLEFEIDPGEGVFYGPKIDIKIRDELHRVWQCTTIQVDYNLPEKFDIRYIGSDGESHQPIMIHRALLGSLERFFGCLIEHYGGDFPLWLAPVQVRILPITDDQQDYAEGIRDKLRENSFRVEIDERSEKIGFKIRDAELQKVPCMLVVGAKEVEKNTVSLRRKGKGELGSRPLDELIDELTDEVGNRTLE
jgi:threonyl-tRNA synthetase